MDKRVFSGHARIATAWLGGGGAMGERIRGFDWGRTPLGPMEHWPLQLQLTLGLCLNAAEPMAIYWGSDYILLYNDAYETVLGDKHPGALGCPAREVWPEIREFLERRLRQVRTRGEAYFQKDGQFFLHRHGHAEECYFAFALNAIRGPGGEVDGVLNTMIDTTERVLGLRRTACLRELAEKVAQAKSPHAVSELATETLAKAGMDVPFAMLYLVDGTARLAHLAGVSGLAADNPACCPTAALDSADAAPWPLAKAVMSGQVQSVADVARRIGILPGRPWPEPAEEALVLPCAADTGPPEALLVAGISPRRALDDDYRKFLQGAALSIGRALANADAFLKERLEREQERAELLRAGEERLRYLTEAAGIGCWDWDVVADRGDCTDRCRAIFGLPPDKPLSYGCFLLCLHPDDRSRTDAAMQRALAKGGDYDVEYRIRRPDGSERWVESKGRVDFGPDGRPQRMAGVVVDITERKAAEFSLESSKTRLEEEVAARTAQLVAANKELQAFAYGVAHDLKSPLRGIVSYSQLLALEYGERLEGSGAEFLEHIQKCVGRMRALIDDLLAYSRIEHGSQTPRPLNLQSVIRRALAEREADMRRDGVELRIQLPAVSVVGDPDGLAQVLRNLIDNALKFSAQASPPVIEIGGEVGGNRCRLWVRDNGLGFDMAQHDRIFEIFQRLHRADDIPGTGIGLALVKKAMERIGGRVWAESVPGRGATFFLELPVQETESLG